MSKFSSEAKRIEATLRLAQACDGDETAAGINSDEVFRDARVAGISTFDVLRTHILLRVANGSTQLVSRWLRPGESEDSSGEYEAGEVSPCRIASVRR